MLVNRDVASYVLASVSGGEVVQAALGLLQASGSRLDIDAGDTILGALEPRLGEQGDLVASLLPETGPTCAYVRASLQVASGQLDEGIETLHALQKTLPEPVPRIQALQARWLLRRGRTDEAARELRLALSGFPDYAFYARIERLVEKVTASNAWKPRRTCRVAVLASSTTALLVPLLRAALFREGIAATFYEGAYGNYRQEILDPSSRLYGFKPEFVLLVLNHRDLPLQPAGGWEQVAAFCGGIRQLWATLQGRNPCHVVQVGFDSPANGAWGALEDMLPEGRRRNIARANLALAEGLPTGVSFVSVDSLSSESFRVQWDEQWHASKQYPGTDALPLFSDSIAAHIRAALGLSAKVLAVDLDNTLWGGVIGEDGLGGIRIGPPSAEGEAYAELQGYVRELKTRGVLLAVCSKNNLEDAEAPFLKHEAMVLRRDDFVAFKANWQDKATNLRAIAGELSLGLDSFVFLDDNPFERAWVREQLPEVAVIEAGARPASMLRTLRRAMLFEPLAVTGEDLQRSLSYQANAAIRQAQDAGGETLESFLVGLNMTCCHGPVDDEVVARVTQLINKTNQFNLTTRRFTTEEVKQMARSSEWWCRWFRLSDRFGDHGLVGVMLARIGESAWRVETWLMSCRVLGRGMEEFMAACVLRAAAEARAKMVTGRYEPTAKNEMVRDLYPRMGFTGSGPGNEFRFDLAATPFPLSPWMSSEERSR